jgi:hypothetical protein
MKVPPHSRLIEPAATALLPVSLAAIDAVLLARMLLLSYPHSLIDCQVQPCRRNVGVCYLLSQLLLRRQIKASVWLCNVDARLRSHLRQLGLEYVFPLAD